MLESHLRNNRARVAWLFTHRIQYFVNLLDEMQKRNTLDLFALYAIETAGMTDVGFQRNISWDNRPSTSFREIVLHPERKLNGIRFFSSFCRDLFRVLDAEKPDVVMINGYSSAIAWQGVAWCLLRGVPYGLRGDGDTVRRRPWWKTCLRRAFVAPAASRAAVVFHQGAENKMFWRQNGVHDDRLVWVPCVADSHLFGPPAFAGHQERNDFRLSLGAAPNDVVFICSGKLQPRKRQADILHAAAVLGLPRARFWFLGSGPDSEQLRNMAETLGVAMQCRWLGFQNQTAIPKFLAAADVLVHPSEHDPWPYAILEGARQGLPLLLSDRVGSTPDWVIPPAGAMSFPCGDSAALANAIRSLAEDDTLRASLASAACSKAAAHTEQVFAEITENAIHSMKLQPATERVLDVTPGVNNAAECGYDPAYGKSKSAEGER